MPVIFDWQDRKGICAVCGKPHPVRCLPFMDHDVLFKALMSELKTSFYMAPHFNDQTGKTCVGVYSTPLELVKEGQDGS